MPQLPGSHYDPNCLHCLLSPQVESFCAAHSAKSSEECIRELACVLGELIGSGVHRSQVPQDEAVELVSRLAALATQQIVHTATMLIFQLRLRPEQKPS
jgi:hypothetical protein